MPNSLQLGNLVQQLKLSGISDSLESRLRQAKDASMPYEELLSMLFQDELDSRNQTSLQRRISQAKFEEVKTFEGFDLKRYSLKIRHAINDLMTAKFIKERNDVIIMGPVGTGKTHLSIALGMIALSKNFKVLSSSVGEMLTQLNMSKADNSYYKKLQYYLEPHLLILDELGFKKLPAFAADDFFEVISKRYEKGSCIITTNKPFEQWHEILGDHILASAILDRIVHHSMIFKVTGPSYRAKNIEDNK